MSKLGKFFTWFFAMEALIFLPISLLIVWRIVHPVDAPTAPLTLLKVVGLVAFVGVNCAFGLLYTMAWWTTWRQKASGRGWAIAASVTNFIMGVSPLVLSHLPYFAESGRGVGPPIWGLSAIGLAGLVVFWHRDASGQATANAAGPSPPSCEIPPGAG